MTCNVPFCSGEAVGEWRWTHVGYIHYPICAFCLAMKRRSKAPGTFTPYQERVA